LSLAIFCASHAVATVRYVDANSPGSAAPYTSWATAATVIQDAIDAASAGDLVLVTNGVYSSGGKAMSGDLTNRVALDKPITLQSVSGPWVTFIQGAGATNGPSAVRCAWLTNGAAIIGFTLEAGATRNGGTTSLLIGGGAWCASSNSLVDNCVIRSNNAYSLASGVYRGTINNCFISGNVTPYAGAYGALLNNCTVVSNGGWGVGAGGLDQTILTNCIVYFNRIANYSGPPTFAYCCTTPLPSGTGNTAADPKLASDGIHLTSDSPCRGTGANPAAGTDIFGLV
jgi:hypothetical protein